jgi:hypothetical protein
MRRRWVETWRAAAHRAHPRHLREPLPLSQALGHLPFDAGFSWDENLLGSFAALAQGGVLPWIWDWSSVRQRWDEGLFDVLQPRHPALWHPFYYAALAMQGACAKKEHQLQGATSVGASGATSYAAAGGGASDDDAT